MNELAQYDVPQWISIAFLVAIPLPFILISLFIRKEAFETKQTLAYPTAVAFFVLYLAYIAFASLNGWFNQVMFPPKVLLLTTFPYAFLLFVVLLNTRIYKSILENASLESLVQLHIFRVIGVFFVLLAVHDALPKPFAFIAGIGDMVTAISSFFVATAIQDKKPYAKRLTYVWNIFGPSTFYSQPLRPMYSPNYLWIQVLWVWTRWRYFHFASFRPLRLPPF